MILSYDFLDTSGWRVSDESIKSGLENTCLIGRSQFLTTEEAGRLGISKSIVILDGGIFLVEKLWKLFSCESPFACQLMTLRVCYF